MNVHRLPTADKPRVDVNHDPDGTTVIRIPPAGRIEAPDELVVFPFGLEPRAARTLVRKGTLTAAKIGRRLYAKRSAILALVDKLAKSPAKVEPTASYAELVAIDRGRR